MTCQPIEIELNVGREKDVQRVFWGVTLKARRCFDYISAIPNNAFREKKAGCQLSIVPWRAHSHRYTSPSNSDFEWFFRRKRIRLQLQLFAHAAAQNFR